MIHVWYNAKRDIMFGIDCNDLHNAVMGYVEDYDYYWSIYLGVL